MAVTKTTQTGLLGNLANSIMAVPIGILFFLASFAVLFKNEGCTNWGEVARRATIAAPDQGGHEAEFISVTGPLSAADPLGDSEFLAPGPWVSIERVAEQYAWVEHSSSESRDKLGGGTETVTTYTYAMEWTPNPEETSRFQEPAGHTNVPMRYSGASFSVQTVSIGSWSLSVASAGMPMANPLVLGPGATQSDRVIRSEGVRLLGDAARGSAAGEYVYLDGTATAPNVGDHRLSFRVVPTGITVTGFGKGQGGTLVAHEHRGEQFLRVLEGDRDAAIASLDLADTVRRWGLRLAGFLMMWFGLQMVFAPLHAIAGILPIAKTASKFVVGGITFLVAAPLSLVTIVVSMILHSWIALVIIALVTAGVGFYLWSKRKPEIDSPAAAT